MIKNRLHWIKSKFNCCKTANDAQSNRQIVSKQIQSIRSIQTNENTVRSTKINLRITQRKPYLKLHTELLVKTTQSPLFVAWTTMRLYPNNTGFRLNDILANGIYNI